MQIGWVTIGMPKIKGNRSLPFLPLFLYLSLFLFLPVSPVSSQTNPVNRTAIVAEDQDYAFALGLYHDGVYQLAEEQFGKFLTHYPGSVRSIDALFLQNECRYYQGKFDTAIQGFTEFVRQYHQSKLVPDAQFRLGDSYLKLKKPTEAIAAYKIVLDQFGESELAGEAAYWIGEGNLQLADIDNAIKYYSLAYENYPKSRLRDYALYSIGWTYQKKNEYAKATDWYGRFLKEFPESSLAPSAKVRIGECYYYSKDYRKAIEVLSQSRKTIAQDDERGQADYLIAEANYQLGDYPEAQKRYEAFLKEYSNHKLRWEVVYALGWALLKQNKFPDAAQSFALDTIASDGLAYASLYRRSVAQKLAGNRAAAIATLLDLIGRDPGGEYADNALFDLGVMAFDDKKLDEARKDFMRVATNFPQSDVLADSYMMVGECLLKELKFKESHDWFERAATNATASFDVELNSGYQTAWCLYKMKMLKESSQKFADFIKAYPQHPKAADAQFWKAEAEFQLGDYDGALNGYKNTVASGSLEKRKEAMYGISWSYFKQGSYQKAIEGFEQLVASYPGGSMSFDARLRIGDAYFELKDFIRAEGSYRVVIRLFPKTSGVEYANYQLGQALFRQGDNSEAYKEFESLIKTYPNSDLADDAQYALGWINFQRKEFADAIREFQKLISAYPSSELVPRALNSTGDSYYNMKQYPEAIKAYRELLSRYPKSSYVTDALNGEEYCLSAQGKHQEAVQVVDSFVKANPSSTMGEDLILKKGDELFGQGDYAGAEVQYRQLVQQYPKSKNLATALYWVAKCLRAQDKLSDAAMTFESAIHTENASPGIVARSLEEAAEIYTAQKRYDKSFGALTRIIKDFKDTEVYPEALYQMGNLYIENGNLIDAGAEFESIISQFPSSNVAVKGKLGLVRIDIENKNYSVAQDRAKDVAAARTDEFGAEAQYLSGLAYSGAKDWKNAITALLRVINVFPSHDQWVAKTYVALGDAYVATEDPSNAKSAYQNALKFKQETETAAEAQKRLEKLQKL
jgi:tol-pal system protein YbgF